MQIVKGDPNPPPPPPIFLQSEITGHKRLRRGENLASICGSSETFRFKFRSVCVFWKYVIKFGHVGARLSLMNRANRRPSIFPNHMVLWGESMEGPLAVLKYRETKDLREREMR